MLRSIFLAFAIAGGLIAVASSNPLNAEEPETFYTVFRYDVANKDELKTEEVIKAHRAHVEKYSKSVTSARILDDNGKKIGVMSIKGFTSREAVEHYVYEDPYTKANLYTKIEIMPIDLYVLNAEYARVSKWFLDRNPSLAHNYTPPKPPEPCECEQKD